MKHVTSGQTRLLLHLRWTMVRQPRSRLGLALLAGSALGLLVGAVLAGARVSDAGDRSFGIALVLPSLLLGFALSAFISPLAAGGGNQLFPPEQLAAFPLRASAHFRSSLLLTPINLAWLLQVVALAGATAFVTGPGPRLILALLVIGTYVGFVTVAGQAAAWWIVGLRQQRAGRAALLSIAGLLLIGAAALLISERVIEVLDRSPTTLVVTAMANAYSGEPVLWLPHVAALALASCVAYLAGVRACAWTLRTPSLVSRSHDARTYRRRARAVTPLGEMLAIDRANVWRSTSMRRGLYVLGLLPGVVAALVGVRWVDLPLLPALVAAGAGMLFGVNAFCLDGSGALWLASLPTMPRALFFVRTTTVVTVGLVTVSTATAAGSLRAEGPLTATALLATLCCAASALFWVTATCLRLSISRPYRADLQDPRDTPAPPGAMAAYSVRLATGSTGIGIAFFVVARLNDPVLPLILTICLGLWSLRSLVISDRHWQDPRIRSRVVATVSTG